MTFLVFLLYASLFESSGLFETLTGRVQREMLLKATEQCFNTLEKAEMLLLLLKRFPESVVQHGVIRNRSLLMFTTLFGCCFLILINL